MSSLRTLALQGRGRCLAVLAILALVGCSEGGGESSGTGVSKGDQIQVELTPEALNFPIVVPGDALELQVTVMHVGKSGTLMLRDPRIESTSAELSLVDAQEIDLEAGMSTIFTVRYAPVDGEQDGGSLLVDSNALGLDGEPLEVPILTTAQVGALAAFPNPVDFETVVAGSTKFKTVNIVNSGFDDVEVHGVQLAFNSSSDFAVAAVPEFPLTASADSSFEISVSYTPQGGGTDEGTLDLILFTEGVDDSLQVELLGAEVGPSLAVFPAIVDFGWSSVGVTSTLPLFVDNSGNEALELTSIALSQDSDPALSLSNAPMASVSVVAGEGYPPEDAGLGTAGSGLQIHYLPATDSVQTTGPIGQVLIQSNDLAAGGQKTVFVYGR